MNVDKIEQRFGVIVTPFSTLNSVWSINCLLLRLTYIKDVIKVTQIGVMV